jgi:hypothetical protein
MTSENKIVISASRRTDIPAFYMPWFMRRVEKQFFEVINPFNRKTSIVPATHDHVHSIVFWSKNFRPFINEKFGEQLQQKGFNLFFNFTINSDVPLLEPHVPPLTDRLAQLEDLCRHFTPEAINWRFDPICFYKDGNDTTRNNLQDFAQIAEKAAALGVSRCITSFMDDYAKIKKRVASIADFVFVDPPPDKKKQLILDMETALAGQKIRLYTCCEKELLNALPDESTVSQSSCIPNDVLVQLYGGNLSLSRDKGQRISAGCGCRVSADIGSYQHHPCYHNCLFCYANPRPVLGQSIPE